MRDANRTRIDEAVDLIRAELGCSQFDAVTILSDFSEQVDLTVADAALDVLDGMLHFEE